MSQCIKSDAEKWEGWAGYILKLDQIQGMRDVHWASADDADSKFCHYDRIPLTTEAVQRLFGLFLRVWPCVFRPVTRACDKEDCSLHDHLEKEPGYLYPLQFYVANELLPLTRPFYCPTLSHAGGQAFLT